MADTSKHPAIAFRSITGYLPLVSYLEWDLAAEVEYTAGQVLPCTLTLKNSQDTEKQLYVLGSLMTEEGMVVSGTEFGVYLEEGATNAVNSPDWLTDFLVEAEGSRTVPCTFTFGASDLRLYLVMLEMQGAEPAVDDPIRGSLYSLLKVPVAVGIDLGAIMMLMVVVMMIGMIMPMIGRD